MFHSARRLAVVFAIILASSAACPVLADGILPLVGEEHNSDVSIGMSWSGPGGDGGGDTFDHAVLFWKFDDGGLSFFSNMDLTGTIGIGFSGGDRSPGEFTTFGVYGLYNAGGDEEGLVIGFADNSAIGQDFDVLFDAFLTAHSVTEADIIDAIKNDLGLAGDFMNEIFDRTDTQGLIDTPVQTGTTLVLVNFTTGVEGGSMTFAAVPEPATLALLAVGGLLLARRRLRRTR